MEAVDNSTSQARKLIELARKGDENAFTALFRAYSPLIDRVGCPICRRGGSRIGSAIRRNRRIFRGGCPLRYRAKQCHLGLYAQICIANRLASALRDYRKIHHTVSLDGLDPDALPAGEESNPAHFIMEAERYADLCRKMEAVLSSAEREVWMLFISGLTAPQIAAQLGVGKKSVENTLYRARKKLRESFSEA